MLTPQQQQEAIEQYLERNPNVLNEPQTRRPVTVAANMNFQPIEEPSPEPGTFTQAPAEEPPLKLVSPDPDLVDVLRYSLNVGKFDLLTPENVFLQQVLRRLSELEQRMDMLPQKLAKSVLDTPVGPTGKPVFPENKPPTQLIFRETSNNTTAETEDEDQEEETEVPKKKPAKRTARTRVPKRGRRAKTSRKDAS